MELFVPYLLLINALSLLFMRADKQRAKNRQYRIPEWVLFLLCLAGGSAGGTAGMFLFRHKTKHWYFAVGFPLILFGHILLALLVLEQG